MISLSKCKGSCNVITWIISVPKEAKYINVKNKAKTLAKYISCSCKCKFNTSIPLHLIQIKIGKMKHVNTSVKIIVHAKRL